MTCVAMAIDQQAPGAARGRLLAELPLTEQRVSVARVDTALLEGGEGPPLVLLHGGIECGGAYWAPVVADLMREPYRLVIPDVPGLGESEPVEKLDAGSFGEWFDDLLRLTCREEPTVVAHSLVGTLAARFAAAHPDRLRRLVIYAVPGIGPYRMPLGLRAVAIRFAIRPTEANMERFERFAFQDLDAARDRDGDWLAAFSGYTRSRAVVPHVKRTMRQLIGSCTKRIPDDELRRITVPVGLVWASGDRFVPLPLAEAASRRLGWPLEVVDDAGHVPHIERPEAFLRALSALL